MKEGVGIMEVVALGEVVMGRDVRGSVSILVIAICVAFYFPCNIFSISVSIFFIWMVCATISFIMSSFMLFASSISLVSGSCVASSLCYFFRQLLDLFYVIPCSGSFSFSDLSSVVWFPVELGFVHWMRRLPAPRPPIMYLSPILFDSCIFQF